MEKEHLEEIKKQVKRNSTKIQKNASQIEQNTGALEVLKVFKSDSKKFFIMWAFTFGAFMFLLLYILFAR